MSLIMGVQYVMSHNYYNITDGAQTLCVQNLLLIALS